MSHPFNEHRAHKVEKERVGHIAGKSAGGAKCYARGGKVHDDEAEDRDLIRKEVKGEALKHDGKKPGHRGDKAMRRARGGKAHHKGSGKTNVNVIVAPGGGKPPMAGLGAPPMGGPPMAAAPPMPPKPPMAPPPGPGGPMGPPPPAMGGMPPRRVGGRAFKKGGKVHSDFGDADMNAAMPQKKGDYFGSGKPRAEGGKVEGKKSAADKRGLTGIGVRTPIQHSGNKSDTQNIGRGPVITKATGGPIYSNGKEGKDMGPNLHAGANSGIGRLRKNKLARAEHWEA